MNIPYGKQFIDKDDIAAVVETLTSNYLTQGPKVIEFENKFAKYVKAKYAVAVSNATAALHISMIALGVKKGDRIITTPITFAATGNCVRFVGGEVWFADINPNTYTLCVESVEKLINSKPKGFFKGIIPVAFAGLPVDLEKFKKLADQHQLWVVEDACHAPGAYFNDSFDNIITCGSAVYSNISVFSFHPVKHIACGEGGMITTNSKEIYDKLILLRSHGITKENIVDSHGGWYYEMIELGFNYRLTEIQAALGISQLKKNKLNVKKRNKIADSYKKAFQGKIKFQEIPNGMFNAYHLFVIEVNQRKELYDFLKEHGIYAQIHYIPMHQLPYYNKIGYSDAELTNAESYYQNCISIPMFPTINNKEIKYVIETILNFINKK